MPTVSEPDPQLRPGEVVLWSASKHPNTLWKVVQVDGDHLGTSLVSIMLIFGPPAGHPQEESCTYTWVLGSNLWRPNPLQALALAALRPEEWGVTS